MPDRVFHNPPKVYFIPVRENDDENLLAKKTSALLERSGILDPIKTGDFVGIKLHFGEKENTGYIKPPIVKEAARLCKSRSKNVTLIETNTIYAGERSNTISHLNLAYAHGFTYEKVNTPVIILDGVTGRDFFGVRIDKKHIKTAKVASGVADFEYILSMAHVTGHCQTGLGAAIKNIGMGCASRSGKLEQHSTVLPRVIDAKCTGCGLCLKWCPEDAIGVINKKASILKGKCVGCGECTVSCRAGAIEIEWNESARNLQEKMAEYAYAALSGRKGGFVNFLIRVTKDCDCMAKSEPAIQPDIGILASEDPVAIDKASTDLLIKEARCDKLKYGYPNIDWKIQMDYAAEIGLGNLEYELIKI